MLTIAAEAEKKVVAPLLGKLYISPTSTEEKIREVYDEVSIAVDDRLVTETTGRNALNKIHVSLGKIVANLGEQEAEPRRTSRSISAASMAPSATSAASAATGTSRNDDGDEDKMIMMDREPTIKEEDEDSNEGTVIQRSEGNSLVSELLSDEEGA